MKKNNMKSYYFPFTHGAAERLAPLAMVLPELTLIRPTAQRAPSELSRLEEEGSLSLWSPAQGAGDDRVLGLLSEYRAWAEMNPGARGDVFGLRGGAVPFHDETSAYHLSTRIMRKAAGKKSAEKRDPLLSARVFLTMAQELDRENDAIGRELARFEDTEKELLSLLKGEAELPDSSAADAAGEPADYMLAERLAAWSRLLTSAGPPASAFFVTDSRKVVQHVLDESPTAERMGTMELAPCRSAERQAALALAFARMEAGEDYAPVAFGDTPETMGESVRLTLYRVPGQTPCRFLEQFHGKLPSDGGRDAAAGAGGTLIGVAAFG